MSRSVVLVVVPEAEPAVERHRLRYDSAAVTSVPAHVTLLFPFAPELDAGIISELGSVFARVEPFDFALTTARRFEQGVLWLAPEPAEPFVALTRAIADRFPEYPPFEGAYPEIVPHLTVAHADGQTMDTIETDLKPFLPISSRAHEAHLMVEDVTGRWATRTVFGFGS